MGRSKPKQRQPKTTAVIAGYIRRSEVKYPADCIVEVDRAEYRDELIVNYQARIRERAMLKGLDIARWYIDLDLSGREYALSKRESYLQLGADIEAGDVSHLFTTETSRIARDAGIARDFRRMCAKYGVAFDAPNFISGGNDATDEYMNSIMSLNDQLHSDLTKQRIIEHNYQAVKTKQWVGSSVNAWGFRYVKDKKGYEVDPATAPFVLLVFETFVECHGVASRAASAINSMIEAGNPLALPAGSLNGTRGRSATNGLWVSNTILQVVRSAKYRREIDYTPGAGWLEPLRFPCPELIPEIVPPEITAEADRLLSIRAPVYTETGRRIKAGRMDYTYSGLIRCGYCGLRMTTQKPTWWHPGDDLPWVSWRCTGTYQTRRCKDFFIAQQQRVDRLVVRALRQWAASYGDLILTAPASNAKRAKSAKGSGKDSFEAALEGIAKRRARTYQMAQLGHLGMDLLGSMLKELEVEEGRIRKQMEAIRVSDEPKTPALSIKDAREIERAVRSIDALWAKDADKLMDVKKHQLLKTLGVTIHVTTAPALVKTEEPKKRRGGPLCVEVELLKYGHTRAANRSITVSETPEDYADYTRWRYGHQLKAPRDKATGRILRSR